jgi:hypothetical protein
MFEELLLTECAFHSDYVMVGCETTNEMTMLGVIVGVSSSALLGVALFRRFRSRIARAV